MLRYVRLLFLVAAAALLVPAAADAAPKSKGVTYPTVKKVSPKKAGIGDTMTVTGKGFRSGKNKNTVLFKRKGGRAVFVRVATATKTKLTFTLPAKLLAQLVNKGDVPQPTRFNVRILARKLGKNYTKGNLSPIIGPGAVGAGGTADDCDGDKVPNGRDADDDNDLLTDVEETRLGLQSCNRDTDGDGLSDGWEQYSAVDRNGGAAKPSPSRRGYPNALDPKDGKAVDSDGDGLSNLEEYMAWATYGDNKLPLSYSGGNPASAGRTPVPAAVAYMDQDGNGFLSDFERDADGDGIPNKDEVRTEFEGGRIAAGQTNDDPHFYDYGIFTPTYLTLAEKETKQDNPLCAGINQVPFYCVESLQGGAPDVQKVDSLDWLDGDSDGDGITDGADDVDHDDISNLDEYLAEIGTPYAKRQWGPLNACYPNTDSRFCLVGTVDVDKDGLSNRDDPDDDGDGLLDSLEVGVGTNPLLFDTDRDSISDAFEYLSAKDLNQAYLPYPGKRPYPNPLDATDADSDFDQDVLTQREEYKAWLLTGGGFPLSYSDGLQRSVAGFPRDGERDVDTDGLTNYEESHGPLSGPDWWDGVYGDGRYCGNRPESSYPGPKYLGTDFIDADTDGDGVLDGADDIDHDGYTNAEEANRDGDWCATYVSTFQGWSGGAVLPGFDTEKRVQPFNPCKPTWSDACHVHPPVGYYPDNEDWASPVHANG